MDIRDRNNDNVRQSRLARTRGSRSTTPPAWSRRFPPPSASRTRSAALPYDRSGHRGAAEGRTLESICIVEVCSPDYDPIDYTASPPGLRDSGGTVAERHRFFPLSEPVHEIARASCVLLLCAARLSLITEQRVRPHVTYATRARSRKQVDNPHTVTKLETQTRQRLSRSLETKAARPRSCDRRLLGRVAAKGEP